MDLPSANERHSLLPDESLSNHDCSANWRSGRRRGCRGARRLRDDRYGKKDARIATIPRFPRFSVQQSGLTKSIAAGSIEGLGLREDLDLPTTDELRAM